MSSLTKYRADSESLFSQKKQLQDRKKTILIFIQRHLTDLGYLDAANRVFKETNIDLEKVDVADNIDLDLIFREYEEYYSFKFGKTPKLVSGQKAGAGGPVSKPGTDYGNHQLKNVNVSEPASASGIPSLQPNLPPTGNPHSTRNRPAYGVLEAGSGMPAGPGSQARKGKIPQPPGTPKGRSRANTSAVDGAPDSATKPSDNETPDLGVVGGSIKESQTKASYPSGGANNLQKGEDFETPMFKPLPANYFASSELRELALTIQREILTTNPNVRWTDIIGLEGAKRLVHEAVVYPTWYPSLFKGILSPWRGILLFGPPGTGKTLLAKAVATECGGGMTFFNISASTIVSKWRGESEKLVRTLFDMAKLQSPAVIFLDEIDSVMSTRGGSDGKGEEHEGSRRMKTELLIQMDGLNAGATSADPNNVGEDGRSIQQQQQVFLLCASNLPWDLDPAMLRRLEKRIFVQLPSVEARKALLRRYLEGRIRWAGEEAPEGQEGASGISLDALATKLEGWSGSDIRLLCKEIAMQPLRRCLKRLDDARTERYEREEALARDAASRGKGSKGKGRASLKGAGKGPGPGPEEDPSTVELDAVNIEDVAMGFGRVRASPLTCDLSRYEEWSEAFGAA